MANRDALEFRGQHPDFDKDPYTVLRRALAAAITDDGLRSNFEQRLKPLLHAAEKPDFETCFTSFSTVAERFLDLARDHKAVPAR